MTNLAEKNHLMNKIVCLLALVIVLILMIAACSTEPSDLPTVMKLPTTIPTMSQTPSQTPSPTLTPSPSVTPIPSPTLTLTPVLLPYTYSDGEIQTWILGVVAVDHPFREERGIKPWNIVQQFKNLRNYDWDWLGGDSCIGYSHFKLETNRGNVYSLDPPVAEVCVDLRPEEIWEDNVQFELRLDETPIAVWAYDYVPRRDRDGALPDPTIKLLVPKD